MRWWVSRFVEGVGWDMTPCVDMDHARAVLVMIGPEADAVLIDEKTLTYCEYMEWDLGPTEIVHTVNKPCRISEPEEDQILRHLASECSEESAA
jgi:hypothetical protein